MTLDKNIINKLIRKLLKFTLWIIISVISLSIILFLVYGLWWEWSMYKPLMAGKFDSYEWKLARTEKGYDGTTKNLERRCKMYHDLTSELYLTVYPDKSVLSVAFNKSLWYG